MSDIILAAALNSGLRHGRGHITLVSNEAATEDAISAKLAHCASIVRDADQNVTWGERFVGVRHMVAQSGTGRDAPEVFLLWNVAVSKIADPQKAKNIVVMLQQLAEDRAELLDELNKPDAPAIRKITVYAPSLEAWLKAHFATLRAYAPLGPLPKVEAHQVSGSVMNPRRPVSSGLLVRIMVVLTFLLILGWAMLPAPSTKQNEDFFSSPIINSPQPSDNNRTPANTPEGQHKQRLDIWKTRIREFDSAIDPTNIAGSINNLKLLCEEFKTLKISTNVHEDARRQIQEVARKLRDKIDQQCKGIFQKITVETDSATLFTNLRSDWDVAKQADEDLRDLHGVNDIWGGDIVKEAKGTAVNYFIEQLKKLVRDHTARFRNPTNVRLKDSADVLTRLANSEWTQRLREDREISSTLDTVRFLYSQIALEFRLEFYCRPNIFGLGKIPPENTRGKVFFNDDEVHLKKTRIDSRSFNNGAQKMDGVELGGTINVEVYTLLDSAMVRTSGFGLENREIECNNAEIIRAIIGVNGKWYRIVSRTVNNDSFRLEVFSKDSQTLRKHLQVLFDMPTSAP